jgi:xanthine dehydrogenase/oxidase
MTEIMSMQGSVNVLLLLIFQYVLGLSPPNLPINLVSGGKILERPVSTGKQDFETNKSVWPLNKPVPKMEAVVQCSGKTQLGYSAQFYSI